MDSNGNGFNNHFGSNIFGSNQPDASVDRAYLEAEEMFAEADKLIAEGKIKESVEVLYKILARNPRFGKAHNHLGWVYENKYKDFKRAEEHYKKALEYVPEYPAIYLNYTYFLSALNRYDELKAHLDKALTVPSVTKEIIYNEYAIMYETQQKPEEAMDFYVKAAMTTLDGEKLNRYKDSINRCKAKIELKNQLGSYFPNNL